MNIVEAKARVRIPDLWRRLDLPGEPKASCKSPFREDRSPSFSVSAGGLLFNDFGTGEAGDVIDFLQLATGLSRDAACRRLIEHAGGTGLLPVRPMERSTAAPKAREKPRFPLLRRGTAAELQALADLRRINVMACILAEGVGLLRFTTWKGVVAWVVTDNERLNAQVRRLDGEPWEGIAAKAQTLPGSWASWPLGIQAAAQYPTILLLEGGPDLLAALHYIIADRDGGETMFFPVCMLGAGQRIHLDALALFSEKRIRIYTHADEAGREAAERWAAQLVTVDADVDCFSFAGLRKADGSHAKDLNDCTELAAADAGELALLLP